MSSAIVPFQNSTRIPFEVCKVQVELLREEIKVLTKEYKENKKNIDNKVEGKVKQSQIRNKEIKKEIETCNERIQYFQNQEFV